MNPIDGARYSDFLTEVKNLEQKITQQTSFQKQELIDGAAKIKALRKNLSDLYNTLDTPAKSTQMSMDQEEAAPPQNTLQKYERYGAQLSEANAILIRLQEKIEKYFATPVMVDSLEEQVLVLEADLKSQRPPYHKEAMYNFQTRVSDLQRSFNKLAAVPRFPGENPVKLREMDEQIANSLKSLSKMETILQKVQDSLKKDEETSAKRMKKTASDLENNKPDNNKL